MLWNPRKERKLQRNEQKKKQTWRDGEFTPNQPKLPFNHLTEQVSGQKLSSFVEKRKLPPFVPFWVCGLKYHPQDNIFAVNRWISNLSSSLLWKGEHISSPNRHAPKHSAKRHTHGLNSNPKEKRTSISVIIIAQVCNIVCLHRGPIGWIMKE